MWNGLQWDDSLAAETPTLQLLRNDRQPHEQHFDDSTRPAEGKRTGNGQGEGACKSLVGRRLKTEIRLRTQRQGFAAFVVKPGENPGNNPFSNSTRSHRQHGRAIHFNEFDDESRGFDIANRRRNRVLQRLMSAIELQFQAAAVDADRAIVTPRFAQRVGDIQQFVV
jgi:hypothetical protein